MAFFKKAKKVEGLPLHPETKDQVIAEKIRILAVQYEELTAWLFDLATSIDGFRRCDVNAFSKMKKSDLGGKTNE
jgi:hypothetical protein